MRASLLAWGTLVGATQLVHRAGEQRRDGASINLSLYTDNACITASTSAPNLTLGLNVCAVTTGLGSFVRPIVPCTSGDVSAWIFTDTGCQDWDSLGSFHGASGNDNCFFVMDGAIASIMLSCDADAAENPQPSQPTSTTSVSVGPVAGGGAAATQSAAATTAGAAAPTTTSTSTNPSSGTSSTSTSTSATGWNSLSYGDRVGIIVAIAVGIPPILLGIWAIWLRR